MNDTLTEKRNEMNQVNEELAHLIGKRQEISLVIAQIKKENGIPIYDNGREEEILQKMGEIAKEMGVEIGFMRRIFGLLMEESKRVQKAVM